MANTTLKHGYNMVEFYMQKLLDINTIVCANYTLEVFFHH